MPNLALYYFAHLRSVYGVEVLREVGTDHKVSWLEQFPHRFEGVLNTIPSPFQRTETRGYFPAFSVLLRQKSDQNLLYKPISDRRHVYQPNSAVLLWNSYRPQLAEPKCLEAYAFGYVGDLLLDCIGKVCACNAVDT